MAIVTSRVGVVIDALVTSLKASTVFADPVEVFDGPVTAAATMWTQAVFVGFDGDWQTGQRGNVGPHTTYRAALIKQELVYINNTSVGEELDIQCSAEAWSGDPTPKTVRDLCLTMLAGVEDVLRTDPTLGIDSSTCAELQYGHLAYDFDGSGNLGAHIPFIVHVVTTIPTS